MKFFDKDPVLELVLEIMRDDPDLAEIMKTFEDPELEDEFLEFWK